jgi:hypothetical protein
MEENTAEVSGRVAVATTKGALREFVVEFLGSLVPGIAFLVGIVPGLAVPVAAALYGLFGLTWSLSNPLREPPPSISVIIFLLIPGAFAFLVLAYLAGHLFYRQDPKIADEASFKRIPRHVNFDGMVRPIHGMNTPPVEFPYHFLKQYLLDRGIDYLAVHVPWPASNPKDPQADFKRRAKHWANSIKLRVLLESPAAYGVLARNEAHVRLSSSMWYVCRALAWSSFVGFGLFSASALSSNVSCSPIIALPLLVLLLSSLAKWAIERTLHYQREREVLFMLEVAHWLFHTGHSPKIFDGLQ